MTVGPKFRGLNAYLATRRKARRVIQEKIAVGATWRATGVPFHSVVLRDFSEPGRFRVQHFDERGFIGHITRDTLEQLVDVLLDDFGPSIEQAPEGTLDRLASKWPGAKR